MNDYFLKCGIYYIKYNNVTLIHESRLDMKRSNFIVSLLMAATLCGVAGVSCASEATYQGGLSSLNTAISDSSDTVTFKQTENITLTSDLSSITAGDTFVYNGNNYNLNGGGKQGFVVGEGKSLTLENAGYYNEVSEQVEKSVSGFTSAIAIVLSNGTTANINNSVFQSNSQPVVSYNLPTAGSSTLNISDSKFYSNTAPVIFYNYAGPPIAQGYNLNINNSDFRSNTSGVLNFTSVNTTGDFNFKISNSSFYQNNSPISMNLIYGEKNSKIEIENSVFDSNNGIQIGVNAICSEKNSSSVDVSVSGSTFINNSSKSVYAYLNNGGAFSTSIKNSSFTNSSDSAVYFNSIQNDSFTSIIDNSTFDNAYKLEMSSFYTSAVDINISDSTFINTPVSLSLSDNSSTGAFNFNLSDSKFTDSGLNINVYGHNSNNFSFTNLEFNGNFDNDLIYLTSTAYSNTPEEQKILLDNVKFSNIVTEGKLINLNLNGNNAPIYDLDLKNISLDNVNMTDGDYAISIYLQNSDFNFNVENLSVVNSSVDKLIDFHTSYNMQNVGISINNVLFDSNIVDGVGLFDLYTSGNSSLSSRADIDVSNLSILNTSSVDTVIQNGFSLGVNNFNELNVNFSNITFDGVDIYANIIYLLPSNYNNIYNLSIKNSVFKNLDGVNYFGIATQGGLQVSNLVYDKLQFINNKNYITSLLFNNLSGYENHVTLANSLFEKNISNASSLASAFYVSTNNVNLADVLLDNNIFKENESQYNGTAGFFFLTKDKEDKLAIKNSEYLSNKGFNGTVYIVEDNPEKSRIIFDNNLFKSNTASENGGAVYYELKTDTFNSNSVFEAKNSMYESNKALSGKGGAIYAIMTGAGTNSLVDINSSAFKFNEAGVDGGAIYNTNPTLDIETVYFESNKALGGSGGAIYNTGNLSVATSSFQNNTATSNGGAIYTEKTASISDTNFTANQTQANGGAIYNNTGAQTISNSAFITNKSTQDGGAVYGGVQQTVSSSAFSQNQAGGNGGALFVGANSSFVNSNFTSNTASGKGGAIYNNLGEQSISKSSFYANKASSDGGAIYAGAKNTISSSDFSNNTSSGKGGALYAGGGSVISNSNFYYNTASSDGGAVYNLGEQNLSNVTFSTNTSNANGGAVYSQGNSVISDSGFLMNKAVNGGAIYNDGTMTVKNTSFLGNTASVNGGAIYSKGTLNVVADNSQVVFSGNKASGQSNAIYLESGTLNLNATNGGSFIINDKIKSADINNNINITGQIMLNESISNSTVNLNHTDMFMTQESWLNGNNLNLNGGNINLINGSVGNVSLNNLSVNGVTSVGIDLDLKNSVADRITSVNTATGTGKIDISTINLLSTSDRQISNISVANDATRNFITLNGSASQITTPIFKYGLSYDASSGNLNVANQGFTSSIVSSPVNSMSGIYVNQANVYQEVLGRTDAIMAMTRMERLAMKYRARSAISDGQVFSPTYFAEASKGVWVKNYSSFENIPLKNGPNVSSVGYGMIVGADSDMVHLKEGFDGYLTVYAAYNGSHQNYDNVGSYQNGGILGVTGTIYKENFFAALTVNAGASVGNATTEYGNDNFTTMLGGAALKTGYNFEFREGRYILQPSFTLAYTMAKTFDYTTAAGVDITSDALHAFQFIPGVKLIANYENGWQPYVAMNMVFNSMNGNRFYANNVELPQLSIDPYFEYGLGVQRKWKERLSGFVQAMARSGGRNGVALQIGFRWAI